MRLGFDKWEILGNLSGKSLVDLLLENRGITTEKEKREFISPANPSDISYENIGISRESINKSVRRIRKAIENNEGILIYGDYDADGICATAILWETLFRFSRNVTPYIPDRFLDGYGINPKTLANLKKANPDIKLVISVDNGIVAFDAVKEANALGIDVIIADHHTKDRTVPDAYSIVHTTKTSGSGIAWVFAKEVSKRIANDKSPDVEDGLELAALGVIADQLPLIGFNRSLAKFGIEKLKNTNRVGLRELYLEAGIARRNLGSGLGEREGNRLSYLRDIGVYDVNYIIAPRLNAMGRLENAMDSLRLLCTKDESRARQLAERVGAVNARRQSVLDAAVEVVKKKVKLGDKPEAIVIAGNYHEGVIGLIAGRIAEEFGRPTIVFSLGKNVSKASARSISNFDIVSEIKKFSNLLLGVGGHPMAAGFTIETKKIRKFREEFTNSSRKSLASLHLGRILRVDCELELGVINFDLYESIKSLRPFGLGNPTPLFLTRNVKVRSLKAVGSNGRHIKLVLEKDGAFAEAIAFDLSSNSSVRVDQSFDIVYSIEENVWQGNKSLQLVLKDIKLFTNNV
jgi:single-stranded-DNA-specific exonuclease